MVGVWKIFLLLMVFCFVNTSQVLAQRVLFVPLDDRPVCFEYTVNTLKAAGLEVIVPPRELIASRYNMGNPDGLLDWLTKEAPAADAAVVSTDALIYGGLVSSRKHEFAYDVLLTRLERLKNIKNSSLNLRLYAYSTIMRTPKASSGGVEPDYYEKFGPQIFLYSALSDKEQMLGLKKKEQVQKNELFSSIPKEYTDDWFLRREVNFKVNQQLLLMADKGVFDYFVMGKDDTAPFSQSHKESRELSAFVQKNNLKNYSTFVGADQLGLVLLTKAVNDYNLYIPFVLSVYAEGKGSATVPSYEDTAILNTVNSHILASGGFVTRYKDSADLVLAVYTPFDGITPSASSPLNDYTISKLVKNFLNDVQKYLSQGKKVAITDIAFGNGSSNALVAGLLQDKTAYKLASYGGWNTASNSLGYALSQGLLSDHMKENDKNKILTVRFLDEWAYQANVRDNLYKKIVWPKGIDGTALNSNKALLEAAAYAEIVVLCEKYGLPKEYYKNLKVQFPWNRMFELELII